MPKPPIEINDFLALPLTLHTSLLSAPATHYIYLKPYEPKLPDPVSTRSLFLLNIPVTTTEQDLKHLLTSTLSGGHIERVHFASDNTDGANLIATTKPTPGTDTALAQTEETANSKKRKRPSKDNEQSIPSLTQTLAQTFLPSTSPTPLHLSGSTAIATFIDRSSRDLTLHKARKHVAKATKNPIVFRTSSTTSTSISSSSSQPTAQQPPLGLARYNAQRALVHPPRATLLSLANTYMTSFSALETLRAQENAKKRSLPDEDGFVTVTRGTRGMATKMDDEEGKTKKKRKSEGLENFYRFQMREKRREEAGELRRRFEGEKGIVGGMMERRMGRAG